MFILILQLRVVFAGHEIPDIQINVQPHLDIAGVRVQGLDNSKSFASIADYVIM